MEDNFTNVMKADECVFRARKSSFSCTCYTNMQYYFFFSSCESRCNHGICNAMHNLKVEAFSAQCSPRLMSALSFPPERILYNSKSSTRKSGLHRFYAQTNRSYWIWQMALLGHVIALNHTDSAMVDVDPFELSKHTPQSSDLRRQTTFFVYDLSIFEIANLYQECLSTHQYGTEPNSLIRFLIKMSWYKACCKWTDIFEAVQRPLDGNILQLTLSIHWRMPEQAQKSAFRIQKLQSWSI